MTIDTFYFKRLSIPRILGGDVSDVQPFFYPPTKRLFKKIKKK